ncbi:MAG: hypothetical protein V4501_03880 [Pseudomonadota bacterium]
MKKSNVTGLALALGAAAVFAFTPVAAVAKSSGKMVHCMGVNACKGKTSCKTANNSCKGKNTCKGQGTVVVSQSVCDQIGGTVEGKS